MNNTIRDSKTTKAFMSSLLISRQKNNCLRSLINRSITELLLDCIKYFLHLHRRKKLSHSARKMHSFEKIFPCLTKISVKCWRELGWGVKLSANLNLIFCWWRLELWQDLVEIIFLFRQSGPYLGFECNFHSLKMPYFGC